MEIKELGENLFVSAQISPSDLEALAARGFLSIIANRPDGEAPDQTSFADISREAHRNGMEVRYIPVVGSKIAPDDVSAFRLALAALPKPILAYCRTGTRSTFLWALSEAASRPLEEIAVKANAAGYDLKNIETRLQEIASQRLSQNVEG